jgi:hypothetical protein
MKNMPELTQLVHGPQGEAKTVRIGIIICARYRDCGGGKCFRALRERQGGLTVAVEKGAKMAVRKGPVAWLRDGPPAAKSDAVWNRLVFRRSGFREPSPSRRDRTYP